MKASERAKAEFLKPKPSQMFPRKEYKSSVRKSKVLGFTTSTGKKLFLQCPQPWCSEAFARIVRQRVGPFFQAAYPEKRHIRVLLDSEPLLHAGPAKEALAEFGIEALPDWPKYSPDVNPQETFGAGRRRCCELRKGRPTLSQTFAGSSSVWHAATLLSP